MGFDYSEYLAEQEAYIQDNGHIFFFYNPHPKGLKTGDCVKRALTKASGRSYQELQLELNRLKKITKSKKFNDNKNWLHYVEKELGGVKLGEYRNMKIGEFAKLNLKGKFVIACRGHLTIVEDGILYDTWNSSFKAINRVWRVN